MLFMVRPENLSLMSEALGNYESREQLDKESMYGRLDPQVITQNCTFNHYVVSTQ
jgi:hypothetical protein